MRRYYTLWGQRLDLESLPPDECLAITQILEVDQAAQSDDDALASSRRVIREHYPTFGESGRVLSGAIGAIYRDLWYRRQINRAKVDNREDEAARILKNIRTHPARIIHDAFLDIGVSQAEFAHRFGLSRSVLSKLVQCFKPRKESKESFEVVFSTSTIIETVSRLAISAHGVYFDQPSPRSEEPREIAAAPTLRERLLLKAIIGRVRELRGENPEAAAQSLAGDLAYIFNDISIHFLDALVKTVIAAARDVPPLGNFRIEALLSADCSERLFPKDTPRSNCLFISWVETEWAGKRVHEVLSRPSQREQSANSSWAQPGNRAVDSVTGRHNIRRDQLNRIYTKQVPRQAVRAHK